MAEIVRAGLVQQCRTGDKESMITAAVGHIATAAPAGAQFYRDRLYRDRLYRDRLYRDRRPDQCEALVRP